MHRHIRDKGVVSLTASEEFLIDHIDSESNVNNRKDQETMDVSLGGPAVALRLQQRYTEKLGLAKRGVR